MLSLNMKFDATIIIASYNQSVTISKSIKELALDAQKANCKVQIIVADDGSNEAEIANIKNVLLKYQYNEYICIDITTQEDKGFRLAAARNNGLRIAKSNIIIFIDGDCIPMPFFLYNHINNHKTNNNVICVGSRGYKSLNDYLNNIETGKYECDYLKKLEDIENYSIASRIKTISPWTAVIGRNFSIKHTLPFPEFEEKLICWGWEDLGYAIDFFIKGYSVVFEEKAKVVQYDDWEHTSNPFINKSSKDIAYTQAGALLLMDKYILYSDIYIELSRYLSYYSYPFDFTENDFVLNSQKKIEFDKLFSQGFERTFSEAKNIYRLVKGNLVKYFAINQNIELPQFIKEIIEL